MLSYKQPHAKHLWFATWHVCMQASHMQAHLDLSIIIRGCLQQRSLDALCAHQRHRK